MPRPHHSSWFYHRHNSEWVVYASNYEHFGAIFNSTTLCTVSNKSIKFLNTTFIVTFTALSSNKMDFQYTSYVCTMTVRLTS
jgi:hypothetical protein